MKDRRKVESKSSRGTRKSINDDGKDGENNRERRRGMLQFTSKALVRAILVTIVTQSLVIINIVEATARTPVTLL